MLTLMFFYLSAIIILSALESVGTYFLVIYWVNLYIQVIHKTSNWRRRKCGRNADEEHIILAESESKKQ